MRGGEEQSVLTENEKTFLELILPLPLPSIGSSVIYQQKWFSAHSLAFDFWKQVLTHPLALELART